MYGIHIIIGSLEVSVNKERRIDEALYICIEIELRILGVKQSWRKWS